MKDSRRIKILQISNILVPILCFLITGIFSIFNNEGIDTFRSSGPPSLIDPAEFAFAIWGPIFLFLGLFLIYQSKGIFSRIEETDLEEKPWLNVVDKVGIFFSLSTILTTMWYIFFALDLIYLTTLFMILYLISILGAYLRLGINLEKRSKNEFISVVIPWSMYAGWVTAATIVSITSFFEYHNFNDPPMLISDTIWAIIVLIVALLIYLLTLIRRNDFIYAGVGIWVLFGVIVQRLVQPVIVVEVITISIIGIIILVLSMIIIKIKKN